MGIISKFKDIMSAFDKDAEETIDEQLIKMSEQLAEVKTETAQVMTEEKRMKEALDQNKANIEKYDQFARKALAAGNEEDAKVFLMKKQEYVHAGLQLQVTFEQIQNNANKMRMMHDKLTRDIQTLKQRKAEIQAQISVAKTQETLNESANSMETSMKAFDELEDATEKRLKKAEALAELNQELSNTQEVQIQQAEIDDELEKMKKEMGL